MTWLQFIIWLLSLYALYYLINIIWDWSKEGASSKDTPLHELTFADMSQTKKIAPEVDAYYENQGAEPVSKGLGGVSMKDLFQLARTETIHLTNSVSF